MPQPKLEDLSTDVAEKIELWVSLVEADDEMCGLWLHGPARSGTSYAAKAALRQLLKTVERYQGIEAFILPAHAAYEDLRALWDSDKSDAPSFAEWASLDAEIDGDWNRSILLVDDWNETVPTDFVMRHFYPRIRNRMKLQKPTIIATRFDPKDATRGEVQFFYDLFVISAVDRSHAGR